MANCLGRKKSGPCNDPIHRCDDCGTVGCDQIEAAGCSNQGFRMHTCLKCGKPRFLTAIELVTSLEARLRRGDEY
jgi:hypothetical protein